MRELHTAKPRLPIILITAHGTFETAIEATKSGAFDYLLKPFEMPEFLQMVEKAVASRRRMTEPVELEKAVLFPCPLLRRHDAVQGTRR